jgi:iron complex transport system permease protein
MQISKQQVLEVWECDKRKERKGLLIAGTITLLIFVVNLCFRYNAYYFDKKFVPVEYFKSFVTAIRLLFDRSVQSEALIEAIGSVEYYGALARLKITLMAFVSGAGLSVAGAIFQTIYKNPMASPNMLGATAGVKLGNIAMIVLYSTQALQLVTLRYQYCYGLTALCVVAILLLGKIAGDKSGHTSVMEMVMAGSVISQGLNVFTMYYMYQLEDEDLVLYQELSMGTYLQLDTLSLVLFFGIMAIALIPMLVLRYRFNVTAIDEVEARTVGVNPAPMKILGQVCAVLMVTASMIHCGDIGMLSMVVPYIVRAAVGADFKKVFTYSCLIGGSLMMLCRLLTSFVLISDEPIPVTFIVNILITPVFLVIMAKQRRAFE